MSANTHHNIPSYAERINSTFNVDELVADPEASVRIALSTSENTMAQIELAHFQYTRRRAAKFGREALSFTVIDRSGMTELHPEQSDRKRLSLSLGSVAIIGRGNDLELPLLKIESISEEHLSIALLKYPDGSTRLSLNDSTSSNGSHLITNDEGASWEKQIIASTNTESNSIQLGEEPIESYDWVYDKDKMFPSASNRKY